MNKIIEITKKTKFYRYRINSIESFPGQAVIPMWRPGILGKIHLKIAQHKKSIKTKKIFFWFDSGRHLCETTSGMSWCGMLGRPAPWVRIGKPLTK